MNGTISSLALYTHLVVPDLDRDSDREDRSRNQIKGIAKKILDACLPLDQH